MAALGLWLLLVQVRSRQIAYYSEFVILVAMRLLNTNESQKMILSHFSGR